MQIKDFHKKYFLIRKKIFMKVDFEQFFKERIKKNAIFESEYKK
jgi:hypothetical protein